jgi:hypothetical protein
MWVFLLTRQRGKKKDEEEEDGCKRKSMSNYFRHQEYFNRFFSTTRLKNKNKNNKRKMKKHEKQPTELFSVSKVVQ